MFCKGNSKLVEFEKKNQWKFFKTLSKKRFANYLRAVSKHLMGTFIYAVIKIALVYFPQM